MFDRYFPYGIAEGSAFLGRETESKQLKKYIDNGCHTLILAPRRYGKTSLAKHVIDSLHIPWIEIDLFVAYDDLSIEKKFIRGVQEILSKIDTPESWLKTLINYFKNSRKTWSVGLAGIHLEISPSDHKDVPENILDALNALEYALSQRKQKAVIFIDEAQEIANVKNHHALEGAIRNFAQSTKHVVFLFSGSSRRMLKHMFNDRARPLYQLCEEMRIGRLKSAYYESYLEKVSLKTWNKKLSKDAFEKIMFLTKRHPRYVYYLCMHLWEKYAEQKNPPTEKQVDDVWKRLVEGKLKDTREILRARSKGQNKLLTLIALGKDQNITGQKAQKMLSMSGSAISQALRILENEDYIEKKDDKHYRIIDPIMEDSIIKYGADYFS